MHRPRSTPHKNYLYASGTHFCQRLSKPQGLVRPEGIGKLKKKLPHWASNQRPSVLDRSTVITRSLLSKHFSNLCIALLPENVGSRYGGGLSPEQAVEACKVVRC
jgi:hypothetical protein